MRTPWTASLPALLLPALLGLALLGAALPARAARAEETPLPRRLLVLYNSGQGQSVEDNLFFSGLQMVANYYGLLPDYLDVATQPLPGPQAMAGYAGVASVFMGEAMPAPEAYLAWLLAQFRAGRRVVVAGDLGASRDLRGNPADEDLLAQALAYLGLADRGGFTTQTDKIAYGDVGEHMDFERALPTLPPAYNGFIPREKLDAWLTLRRADKPGPPAAAVSVGRRGAFAMGAYLYWQDPLNFQRQWYLDPFAFLAHGLGLDNFPALTPTTLNGSRVAFSHIDGDAFAGYTDVDKTKNCAEVLLNEIFKKYETFPITASVIVAEIDPALFGNEKNVQVARDIFALPNIEPASHTYSHPMYWDPDDTRSAEVYHAAHAYKIKGYDRLDARTEIVDSCAYISRRLAPPDKPCRVLLWSGDCKPMESQIGIAEQAGLLNMNGGDTVYNFAMHNSLFYVSGLYRPVGGQVQVFAPQANENIMTNLWSTPLYGFRNTIDTYRRTGSPRRLMPIDVYYHFYSGEKLASVNALKDVYDWVLTQDVALAFASDYIRMVRGFLSARLAVLAPRVYAVEGYGDCLSVRFEPDGPVPDLARCENVLGYVDLPEGLFVHLAPGAHRAVVSLTLPPGSAQAAPYLEQAAGWVRDLAIAPDRVRLRYAGHGRGRVVLAGLAPGSAWSVSGVQGRAAAKADAKGRLVLDQVQSGLVEAQRQ